VHADGTELRFSRATGVDNRRQVFGVTFGGEVVDVRSDRPQPRESYRISVRPWHEAPSQSRQTGVCQSGSRCVPHCSDRTSGGPLPHAYRRANPALGEIIEAPKRALPAALGLFACGLLGAK
jgi:hypothetical protein